MDMFNLLSTMWLKNVSPKYYIIHFHELKHVTFRLRRE